MANSAEGEARKALTRLLRAAEKGRRELEAVRSALRHLEGDGYPEERCAEIEEALGRTIDFVNEEGNRLRARVLRSGGIDPRRIDREDLS